MNYFKLGDAFKELVTSQGAKDTALAGAKLVGKTLFNTGKLLVEKAPEIAERANKRVLQEDGLSKDQRQEYEQKYEKSKIKRIEHEIAATESKIQALKNDVDGVEKKESLERDLRSLRSELEHANKS